LSSAKPVPWPKCLNESELQPLIFPENGKTSPGKAAKQLSESLISIVEAREQHEDE
jgi:hypothetical protein